MDAAIRTPEILDLIFQHLRFTEELSVVDERTSKPEYLQRWWRKKRTLLNAALTCKRFFQPAMVNLWWKVDGIMPLIKLLPHIRSGNPQGAYYTAIREWVRVGPSVCVNYAISNHPQYLDEPLDEESMERFDFYAKMVTHIVELTRMGEDSISNVLIQLAEVRPSGRCFPRLRTVQINSFNPDPMLFFTSPSLQNLQLRGHWTEERFRVMTGLIGRLPNKSPDLQVLDVPFTPSLRGVEAIIRLSELKELTVRQVAAESLSVQEFLKHLAELPRLYKLTINLPHNPDGTGVSLVPPFDNPFPWFPSLKSLSVGGSPDNITALVQYLKSTSIEDIDVRFSWPQDLQFAAPEVLAVGVTTLTQSIQADLGDMLRSISIRVERLSRIHVSVSYSPTHIAEGFITPLLSIPGLETVCIDPLIYVPNLTDDFLPAIPQSWPRLKKLSLPSSGNARIVPFTFSGVQTLIAGLPHLSELALDFIASGTPNPNIVSPQLKTLDVRSSPVWNKRSTSLNLARAFPNLETLRFATDQGNRMYASVWKEVAAWLPVITGRYNALHSEEDQEVGVRAAGTIAIGHPESISSVSLSDESTVSNGNMHEAMYLPPYGISDSESEDPLGYESSEY